VVVGAGKSALDCAAWAARRARSATLVFRRPAWMVPRYLPGGVPGDRLVVSRIAEAFLRYHRQGPGERLLHGPGRALVGLFWGGLSRALHRLLRMPAGLVPARPLPAGVEEIAVVDDFYDLVRAGRIDARRGEIARCTGGTSLELTDGTRLDADLVVFATGWRQDVSFLHEDIRHLVERDGRYHLYRFILPPGVTDLGFVGWNSSIACQLSSEIAAHWLSTCFAGELQLPGTAEMEREIARVHRWAADVMPRRSQGYFIGPLLAHHIDELLDDLGVSRRRTRTAFGEYLLPLWPTRYRGVGTARRRRHAALVVAQEEIERGEGVAADDLTAGLRRQRH
jgi:cation diffusion facilitator CzcD-associated flavoprotein CzcO